MLERILYQFDSTVYEDIEEVKELKILLDEGDKIRAYSIASARWNWIRFGCKNPEQFKENELFQIETLLGERFGVPRRPAEFIQKPDGIYSKDFPHQDFDKVLQRGVFARQEAGSVEGERENAEVAGWIQIREKLLDPHIPLGSQFIVISGPGLPENTSYRDNYIDLYESVMDFREDQRFIRRKRFLSGLSYEDYIQEVKAYKPNYFKDYKGPIDAWFLGHPIFIDARNPQQLFERFFQEPLSKMPQEEFETLFETCMPLILNYINFLTSDFLDDYNIKLALNAILVKADALKTKKHIVYAAGRFMNVQQEAGYLGQQSVEELVLGCGLSGAFRTKNHYLSRLFRNSVAQFEEDEEEYTGPKEYLCCQCPACGKEVLAEIYLGKIHCPKKQNGCGASAPYNKQAA